MNHDDKRSKNLTNLVATDASRNHLRRQGRSDRSIREIFSELVLIVGLLESDKPWIDAEARAGRADFLDCADAADLGDFAELGHLISPSVEHRCVAMAVEMRR